MTGSRTGATGRPHRLRQGSCVSRQSSPWSRWRAAAEGRPLPLLRLLAILLLLIAHGVTAQQHAVKGMVVSVNRAASTFTASIEEIPGFMRAMRMPFEVRQVKDLDGLAPGAMVE